MSCDGILDISAKTIRDGKQIKIKINYKNNIIVGPNDMFFLDRWEVIGGDIEELEEIFINGIVPYYMNENIWMDENLIHMTDIIPLTESTGNETDENKPQINFLRRDITNIIRQGIEVIIDRDIKKEAVYIYRFVYFVGGEWCASDIIMTSIQTPINSYIGEDYSEYTELYPILINGIGFALSLDGTIIKGKRPCHVTRWNHRKRGGIESNKISAWQIEDIKHLRLINNVQRACEYELDKAYERVSNLDITNITYLF